MSIQTYLVDNFTLHAASALAAGASLRSLAGFGFPLFASESFFGSCVHSPGTDPPLRCHVQ